MAITVMTGTEVRQALRQFQPHKVHLKKLQALWESRDQLAARRLIRDMQGWCGREFGGAPLRWGIINKEEMPYYAAGNGAKVGFPDPDRAQYEYDPEAPWHYRGSYFHFRDARNAFHFKLRWG